MNGGTILLSLPWIVWTIAAPLVSVGKSLLSTIVFNVVVVVVVGRRRLLDVRVVVRAFEKPGNKYLFSVTR